MPESEVLKTPTHTELAALWRRSQSSKGEPVASEPITVNRALIWTVGILGFIGSSAILAGVGALWNQGVAITRIDAKMETLTEQVRSSTAGRYTSADAASDRAALLQTFNTTREAWGASFRSVLDQNTEQSRQIDDLRSKVTRLETIVLEERRKNP